MKILLLSFIALAVSISDAAGQISKGTIKGGKQVNAHSYAFPKADNSEALIDTFIHLPGVKFLYRHDIDGGYLIIYNVTKEHTQHVFRSYYDGTPLRCVICGKPFKP